MGPTGFASVTSCSGGRRFRFPGILLDWFPLGTYGLSLAAIGPAPIFTAHVARLSGTLLLLLGLAMVVDVVLRAIMGGEPEAAPCSSRRDCRSSAS